MLKNSITNFKEKLNKINWKKYSKIALYSIFILYVIGLIVYIFVAGIQGDDMYYAIHPETFEKLDSISDFIDATNSCYRTWNGRYVINFLNHMIINCGMYVQTGVVIVTYLLATNALYKISKQSIKFVPYFFLLTGFFAISSQEYFFNITNLNISLNYFFGLPFYLLFLYYLLQNKKKYKPFEFLGLCILGLLCGCLSEAYSFSLAILIFIKIISKEFNLRPQNIIIGAFYITGILTLILCPGVALRTAYHTKNPLFIAYWFNGIINAFCDWALFPVIMIGLAYKFNNLTFKNLDATDQTLLIWALIQIIIMIFSPYLPERSVILFNLILISLSIKWMSNNFKTCALPLVFAIALCGQLIIQAGIQILL